jgi:hypothetical protein
LAAYRERLKELPLRHRRDIHGFLTAIETSAILYKAQRSRDANGRIVAMIDDYRHAHEAFDQGVAGLSSIAVPETLAAVVNAVEAIGAATETARAWDEGTSASGVKVSWQARADKLGIARNTAGARLSEAVERGLLKLSIPPSGYSRTGARRYEVVKSSEELEGATARINTVFPSPEDVRREIEKQLATSVEREAGQASCASFDPSQHNVLNKPRNNPKPLSDAAPFRRDVKPKGAP